FLEHRVAPLLLAARPDAKQWLAVFDGLAVLHEDANDFAASVGFNLVHQLHGFDDAESLAGIHDLAELYKGLGAGAWRLIVSAHDRGFHDVQVLRRSPYLCRSGSWGRSFGHCRSRCICGRDWLANSETHRRRTGTGRRLLQPNPDVSSRVFE